MTIRYDREHRRFDTDDATITFCPEIYNIPEEKTFRCTMHQGRARKLVIKYHTRMIGMRTAEVNALYRMLGYPMDPVDEVYEALKDREIHPAGEFDNAGRFYAENSHLLSCRTPSRAHPYSQILSCRTRRYVKWRVMSTGISDVKRLRGLV